MRARRLPFRHSAVFCGLAIATWDLTALAQTVEPPPVPESHAKTPPVAPPNPEPNMRRPQRRVPVKKGKTKKKPTTVEPTTDPPPATPPTPIVAGTDTTTYVKPNTDGIIELKPKPVDANEPTYTTHEEDKPREDLVAKLMHPPTRIFVGAHYGLTILPPFITNMFARGASTMLFHRVGAHIEIYKPKFSMQFALDYVSLSSGAQLLGDTSQSKTGNFNESFSDVGYFAYVESQLKAVSANVDFLWGFPLSTSSRFELGFGLGAGAVFGSLYNNWVYEDPNGAYSYKGRTFSRCTSVTDGPGCRPQDHASPLPVKVGSNGTPYAEPSWFGSGSKPVVLPHVAIPQIGFRFGFGDLALRIAMGMSLTGPFARLDGSWGLPDAPKN